MGYYSEVGIAMKKAGYEELKRKIAALPEEEIALKKYVKNLLSCAKQIDPYSDLKEYAGKYVVLHWDSIKWYMFDDMPEVDFLIDYIKTLQDYSYMRIGEEAGDIEEDHKGDYNLDIFSVESKLTIR
nr:hypothetical protein [uncultured Dialister sp.]